MVIYFIPHKPPESVESNETKSLFSNKNYLKTVLVFCLIALVQFGYRILIAL